MSDEAKPWQQGSFAETNLHMLEKNILCDVTLIAGKNEEPVWAHKFMLASRSPVFYAMLCGSFAESNGAIRVPDIEADILRNAIQSIYTGDCTVSGENAMALLYVAQKYALEGLVKKCSEFLTEHMDTDNVCSILQQAILYNKKDLENKCLAYIVKIGEEVLQTDSFKHLDKQALQTIMELDDLGVEEEHVYTACVDWAKRQCMNNEKDVSDQNIRECLGELLYLVRFPTMPMEIFTEVVSQHGILTSEEKVAVFQSYGGIALISLNFSKKQRNFQHNIEIERFGTISSLPWAHKGKVDAISFSCSNDVHCVGVSLLLPISTGSIGGSLEVSDEDQTVYKQQIKLSHNESRQFENILFDRKIKIKSGKVYTLKQLLQGPNTLRGSRGRQLVTTNKVSVTFSKSTESKNGTSVDDGQFYRLLLRC